MATLTATVTCPAEVAGGISRRVLRFFRAQVEDWYDVCRQLSDWEGRNLAGQAIPERIAEHLQLLDELERVGRWMMQATQDSEFPDQATAELVAMTVQDLKDARALWHGNMSKQRRQEILRDVFNEP
jgi:hypothetical protein